MNSHPYLRAYLAGIFVPTLVLPLILAGFITVRLVLALPVPIERFVIFPMAVVPSLFGLWNMLYLASHTAHTSAASAFTGRFCRFSVRQSGHLVASCLGMLQISAHGIIWFQVFMFLMLCLPLFFWQRWQGITWCGSSLWGSLNRVMGIA